MRKRYIYKIAIIVCGVFSMFTSSAQQVNTMYFMENVPVRNYLNPAFQPLSNFYLGFPVLGYTQFSLGNNCLSLKDFAYNDANGKPIWFLNKNGDKDKFYNALKPNALIQTNAQVNLLDFGFRSGRAYWSFSMTEKVEGQMGLPKDLLKLLLYGTPDVNKNSYDLTSISADMTAYTEVGLGYSRKVNEKLSVGGKLKLLLGTANSSISADNLNLNASIDQWNLLGNGTARYSSPALLTGDTYQDYKLYDVDSFNDWLKPSGIGAGIDLGATYKLTNRLTLSAAVTDLGFIRWTKNTKKVGYKVDFTFNGLDSLNINNTDDMDANGDSIFTAFKNSVHDSTTNNSPYTSYTSPKINIGIEYAFFNNKVSIGLLSRTLIHNRVAYEELTGSINLRPTTWFDLSGSYSVLNGRGSNIGAGLGLRTGFIHWFLSADYIPLKYATVNIDNNNSKSSVPYNTKGLNVALGVNFVFGNRKDADKDGVVDRKDKCPETPMKVKVDKKGCPVDTDGDGVPDYIDQCSDTPAEAYGKVDVNGCPLDSDKDGVPDYLDKCPDTAQKSIGLVDKDGCSLDFDGDGVFDYLDKCPNTPANATVDSLGCPLDKDGDGVADYLDKCPGTPAAARGMIDEAGCPLDKDSDGVADYLDKCPNTPIEARSSVDKNGCPLDTDGDGIFDYLDNCPKLTGVISNHGCPEIKKEVKKLFQKALQGIQFQTGVSTIKPSSFLILNQIAQVLIANPTYLIEIQGHTDNVGKPASNLILSDKRAAAVRDYLIKKGVNNGRMTSHGYGDTKPVAENTTPTGKAKNRRVEFVVTFEETSFE